MFKNFYIYYTLIKKFIYRYHIFFIYNKIFKIYSVEFFFFFFFRMLVGV